MSDRGHRRGAPRDPFPSASRTGGEPGRTTLGEHGPAPSGQANADLSGFDGDRDSNAGLGRHEPGRSLYIDEFRIPASLEADGVTNRAMRPRSSRRNGVLTVLTGGGVAGLVFAGTVLLARMFPSQPSHQAATERADTLAQVERPALAQAEPPKAPSPRLESIETASRDVDEPVLLKLSLSGTAEGGRVMIKGLVAGSAVSGGRPLGDGAWRVDIAHLADVRIRPPRGFVGPMTLALELRLADDSVADQRSVRLEWIGPDTATTNAAGDAGPSDSGSAPSPEERQAVASMVARGKELLRNGDFSSARLILKRAADAHDADAALTLGATYDPVILSRLGIRGQVANVDLALMWYERANKFGSTEASSRVKRLTSSAH